VSELASAFRLNKASSWTLRVGATLIIDGERRILVDSGYFETLGELDTALHQAAGLGSDDITDVYYTHLHYDHYSPLLFAKTGLRFHMPRAEYHFINALMQYRLDADSFCAFLKKTHDLIAPVFLRQFLLFANDPRYELDRIANGNEIHLCDAEERISPHVTTIALPGHCPGQLGLELETRHGAGIVAGDAVICLNDYTAADTKHHLIVHNREQLLASRQRVAQADFVIPGHGDWFDPRQNTVVTFQENSL